MAGAAALVLSLTGASRLAWAADADKGKAVFEECAACHTLDGNSEGDGPSLQGVFGRKAASRDDYRYSAAMTRSGVTWDAEALDKYVADPEAFIPGNKMAFAGIPDKTKRDDLMAYLAVAAK
jgi:cytochrome c